LRRDTWSDADLAGGPINAAMIQPYLRSIETEGERSLFWFGGVFSHAIRKVPEAGGWLANMPGKTTFVSETPPAAAMTAAESARAAAPKDLLYVRIDLVLGNDGKWRVIEIEAIEPYLFLDFAPEGARAFVGAIARVLG
jgi:glutathione synthase/RimK-type ligase-like ATP-grasp enzyme